jgi:predicted RNA binding protein YcfA (HicA-like mRNA interferase family)
MSDKLPRISGKQMRALLTDAGFEERQAKGSHTFHRHPDGRRTTVAAHGAEALSVTMVSKILRDIGMSHDEYRERVRNL